MTIGVNAGEPIAEDDDLFASVIAAVRIAARANGGEVLVSDVVRQLVAGKGFLFSDTARWSSAASTTRCGCMRSGGGRRRHRQALFA